MRGILTALVVRTAKKIMLANRQNLNIQRGKGDVHDLNSVIAEDSHTRVGGAQVDSNCGNHDGGWW